MIVSQSTVQIDVLIVYALNPKYVIFSKFWENRRKIYGSFPPLSCLCLVLSTANVLSAFFDHLFHVRPSDLAHHRGQRGDPCCPFPAHLTLYAVFLLVTPQCVCVCVLYVLVLI